MSMNLPHLQVPTLDGPPWSDTPSNIQCWIACGPMPQMARRFCGGSHRWVLGDPIAESLGHLRGGNTPLPLHPIELETSYCAMGGVWNHIK